MKKRLLATALCASMVLSSSVAFAADTTTETGSGNGTGTGKVEGVIDKEVFAVTLPTVDANTYDFILDPQNLISQTENAAYAGATFSGSTGMYFQTSNKTYSEKSASATVANRSAVDIDLTMDVKVDLDTMEGISIENAADLTSATPSFNLALVGAKNGGAEDDAVYVGTDGTLSKTVELENDAADYKAAYEGGAYVYKNTETSHEDSKYVFNLTGAANTGADVDWSGVKDKTPSVTVTWSYAKHVDNAAPSIATKEYTMSASTPIDVVANLGVGSLAAQSITSVQWKNQSNMELAPTYVTISSSKVTIPADTVDTFIGQNGNQVLIIVFDNGNSIEVTLKH